MCCTIPPWRERRECSKIVQKKMELYCSANSEDRCQQTRNNAKGREYFASSLKNKMYQNSNFLKNHLKFFLLTKFVLWQLQACFGLNAKKNVMTHRYKTCVIFLFVCSVCLLCLSTQYFDLLSFFNFYDLF